MTTIIFENKKFIQMLGMEKCSALNSLLEIGGKRKVNRFIVGSPQIVTGIDQYHENDHLIVINAEPDFLGSLAEKSVISKLSKYGQRITFFTANQNLSGISNSILPLTFEQLDRLRSPRSNSNWTFACDKKIKNISMLYSKKEYTTGHVIRKYIYEKYKDSGLIDFFMADKNDHNTHIENRKLSLENYRYNLIIENTFDEHHISDQLKDSFIGKCIPIYLGNATRNSKLYEDNWGISWNGVIDIRSEGLDNILKRVDDREYTKNINIVERNSECMRKRQISLGWDGNDLNFTDMSWLGRLIILRTIAQIKDFMDGNKAF